MIVFHIKHFAQSTFDFFLHVRFQNLEIKFFPNFITKRNYLINNWSINPSRGVNLNYVNKISEILICFEIFHVQDSFLDNVIFFKNAINYRDIL